MAKNRSVQQWMVNLKDETELECMCVLQGKSLAKESSDIVFVVPKLTKDHVITIHRMMVAVKLELKKLSKCFDGKDWKSAQATSQKIFKQTKSQISNCRASLHADSSRLSLVHLEQNLLCNCEKLSLFFDSGEPECQTPDEEMLRRLATTLEHGLQMLADDVLNILVKSVVDKCSQLCSCLRESGPTIYSPKGTGTGVLNGHVKKKCNDFKSGKYRVLTDVLSDFIVIGLQSNYMCSLLAKAGAVRALLEICRSAGLAVVRGEALRALATICCVSESIHHLEKNGGIGCLVENLANTRTPEKVRSEAAGVIAQITSPVLGAFHVQIGLMENMPELVKSLTDLCRDTRSSDVFLVSCAALANLTSIDRMSCEYLTECKAHSVVSESCLAKKAPTVFAREQVATILDNMAACEGSHENLTSDKRVFEVLIQFLGERQRPEATDLEAEACEKVLWKASSAVDHLCFQTQAAVQFVQMKCIPPLVRLCKDPVERNHSDAVLMTSLGALRKIFSVCGPNHDVLKDEKEASRLVTSKIIDSFVLCTSADESFI